MSEFWSMNGHGLYIWGAYGAALLVFILEIALLRHRRKATLQRLRLMRGAGDEE